MLPSGGTIFFGTSFFAGDWGGSLEKLEEEIRLLLSDRKRSGAPPIFTSGQIMAIIALACKDPYGFGYEVSQWSLPLLVAEIKKQKIADQISAKSVSRFFKNEVNLKPHKVRYWLHFPEKAEPPDSFAKKVNEICKLYQNAQEASERGIHVVSTDEMTDIQALEHKYPDKLPQSGQCAKMEFEYIRHGTTGLIGFFDIATDRMGVPYLNSTRTEEDFVKAVETLTGYDLSILQNTVHG